MSVPLNLVDFVLGRPASSDPKFTHTVRVVSEAEIRNAWPRVKRATMIPDFGPMPDFALELDLSCPKCGTAPKVKRISESEVEVHRHHPIRCLLVRTWRALA